MSEFAPAVAIVLEHEKGFVDNPNDPGGATAWGLSQRTYPELDMRTLTREQAQAIYYRDWWDGRGFEQIASQRVTNKVFDMAVNMGLTVATRLVQRAVNYLMRRPNEIVVDGVFGPATIAHLNGLDPDLLVDVLRGYHARWYIDLVEGPDVRYETFARGWMRRALQG